MEGLISLQPFFNNAWGDRLTSFNGNTITYDEIGNPIEYYNGAQFTWLGRQLVGATYDGKTMSFTYNDEGIRTSKTVDGITTNYYYSGSQLVAEETRGNITVYLYDATGSVIGMQYHEAGSASTAWDIYWFEKNLQGDIVAIYNASGTKLVSYTYDAWGNATVVHHNGGESTSVVNNRFTYRGYYYDYDLGLYYLQSRYYDSNTGRFISADGYVSTGQGFTGYNMYVYCGNNPVMHIDQSGKFFRIVAVAIVIGLSLILLSSCQSEQEDSNSKYNLVESEDEVVDGKVNYSIINVEIDGETKPGIKIYNSFSYTSNREKREILEYIIGTEEARTAGLSQSDIDYYIKEWSVHNFAYRFQSLAAKKMGTTEEDIKIRAKDVDLNTSDSDRDFYETWGGFIGVFY